MPEQSSKKQTENPSEARPEDADVAPWNAPTLEQKEAVQPVRDALRDALADVDSQAKADQVIRDLETTVKGQTAGDVKDSQPEPANSAEAAQQVEQAKQAAPAGAKAQEVLAETARAAVATEGREREAVSQAAQEALNPEQRGAPEALNEQEREQREYLQRAVFKRLKPLDALDAQLFLTINHLPHTRFLNGFFHFLTTIFTAGAAWYALMALVSLHNRRFRWHALRKTVIPLAVSSSIIEFPIKSYFRRKRPFISIIQAVVIGRKPGSWSFPSGHSAVAFAGAWLLSQHFPKRRGLLYTIAGLVGFSRIYLGAHYPGDVVVGSTLGTLFAIVLRYILWPRRGRRQK